MSTENEEQKPFVTKSGAISYVGGDINPFTGVKDDFNKVTSQIPSNKLTRARAIVADADPTVFQQATSTVDPNQFFINAMQALAGYGSGSGSGGNTDATQLGYAELAYKKQQDEKDRAAALEALQFGRARNARKLAGFQDYYGGGEGDFNKGFDDLLDMIKTQGGVSQKEITNAYGRATTNIGEGYDAASGLGTSGFNALNQYLAQNQNNPYAGMRASVGSAPDALSSYLSAYGVSDQPVQGQIQADQLQAQQGAGNYQNLIDLLGATAQQGAASRGAESQMAQLLFNTGLGQDRAGYTSQAANAQAQALAALQQQMFQSRFGVEGDRNSLANELVQTILNDGGTIDEDKEVVEDSTENEDKGVVKPVQTRAEKVAAAPTTYASFKEAAKILSPKAVEKFTADGSGLSAKEVSSLKKEFPALAKVFETAKKPKK